MKQRDYEEIVLTNDEKATLKHILDKILLNENARIHYDYGTFEIEIMQELYRKLKFDNYCKKLNIKYEDLSESDIELCYLMENEG